jgi:hypothetical protein
MDVTYYAPVVQTTLNLGVYLYALLHYPTLYSPSHNQRLQTFPLRISKKVPQTVPVSKP